jgi:hypothetical protein
MLFVRNGNLRQDLLVLFRLPSIDPRIFWSKGGVGEQNRFVDSLEIERTMDHASGNIDACASCYRVHLLFLTQAYPNLGSQVLQIVPSWKEQIEIEAVTVWRLFHENGLGDVKEHD